MTLVKDEFDLFVIGGGSGGVRASRMAANLGLRVGLAEEYRFGGTCVIRGCVPKKLMVFASDYANKFQESKGFGWNTISPTFSWKRFSSSMLSEIDRLETLYESMLHSAGVQTFKQRAKLNSPSSIILDDGRIFKARYILLAAGGEPSRLSIQGEDQAISSNDIFSLAKMPERLIVIGGGYIACEFASIFNGLGVKVRQIYRGEKILRGFDDDIRTHVENCMRDRGVIITNNVQLSSISKMKNGLQVCLSNGEKDRVDQVLLAVGRRPKIGTLGLDNVGLKITKTGAIQVDRFQKTSVDSIYAVGDITDRVNLTPVAIRDAVAFIETVFRNKKTSPDHSLIPTAIFTRPEVGTVGLTEVEAAAAHKIKIFKTSFAPMGNRISNRKEQMLIKLIVCRDTDKVLGCHIVGDGASEMIQVFGIAIKMGVKKSDLEATCAVHPTLAEEIVTLT